MNLLANLKRIAHFLYGRRREVLSKEFWDTVARVTRSRFNFWERVGGDEYERNLRAIELRPWSLYLELTNICNSNCIFCAYQYQTRPRDVMSDTVFRKALDDYCAMGGGDLLLEVIVGDPALDPKFIWRIRQARVRPEIASIETITNGIAFEEGEIPELVRSGISKILISTGPWKQELYEEIYRNRLYKRVLRNIRSLLEENAKAGCPVEIKIAFRSNLSMRETILLPDYQEVAHLPHKVEFNTDFDTWGGRIKAGDLLPGMHLRPPVRLEREPCWWLYEGPTVFADGRVGLCACRDLNADSELVVGDIMARSLLEIWRSGDVQRIREQFRRGDFPGICRGCTMYVNLGMYRTRAGSERARITLKRLKSKEQFNIGGE